MTATETTPLRWSSVRNCPRMALYEADGAPARPRTRAEENTLARGKDVGRGYVVRLANGQSAPWKIWVDSGPNYWVPPEFRAASEGDADAVAELRVHWPLGIGHADLFVKETNTVVEVLSSQHASGEMVRSKLLQAAGYARSLDATSLALAIVNPVDYSDDRIVITAGTPNWDDLMEDVDARIAEIVAARDTGTLPGRVCEKPSQARGHFCQYADHCFEGWEPEPLETLDDHETHQLAAQLFHAKAKEREVKQTLAVIESERKEIETELNDTVEPGKWQVGPYQLTKSPRRRESFKLTLARQDSRIPEELLDEFTTVSDFTVWTIDQNGASDIDYGPSPF